MKIAIIGAGLAGLSAGHILQKNGADVTVFEANNKIASCASGNDIGMVNPRISAHKTPIADFYSDSFYRAIDLYQTLPNCNWNPCGALHMIVDEKFEKRYTQTVQTWGWDESHMHIVDCDTASTIAGLDVQYNALYLSQSGSVSPRKVCESLAQDLNIHYESFDIVYTQNFDAIIIACGMASKDYIDIPLKGVRGQITHIEPNTATKNLKTNLHYGGYISAPVNGIHAIGATFQRWTDHTDIMDEDDDFNLEKLAAAMPNLGAFQIAGHRASIRTTTRDYAPIIGHVRDNVYISTAHGSHGLVTSIGAAHILNDMVLGNPVNTSPEILTTLSPLRF